MVRLHPEASRELEATVAWYAERSRRAAGAFLGELEQGLERIEESPARWPRFGAYTRR